MNMHSLSSLKQSWQINILISVMKNLRLPGSKRLSPIPGVLDGQNLGFKPKSFKLQSHCSFPIYVSQNVVHGSAVADSLVGLESWLGMRLHIFRGCHSWDIPARPDLQDYRISGEGDPGICI